MFLRSSAAVVAGLLAISFSTVPTLATSSSDDASCAEGGCPKSGAAMLQVQRRDQASNSPSAPSMPDSKPLKSKPSDSTVRMSRSQRVSLVSRAQALHTQAVADSALLRKAMTALGNDPDSTVNALDQLIQEFMKDQGTDEDRCPAKLLEAKHQLNSLHKHMYSIAFEINNTQTSLKIVTKEIEVLEAAWKDGTEKCNEQKQKCRDEVAYYKKQWHILIWELVEMKQIASPGTVITQADMSYAAWDSAVKQNWTHVAKTSNTNYSSWEEWSEAAGTGSTPDYVGSGEKPGWWPTLVQMSNVTGAESANGTEFIPSGPAELEALVAITRKKARELSACRTLFGGDDDSGDLTLLDGKGGKGGKGRNEANAKAGKGGKGRMSTNSESSSSESSESSSSESSESSSSESSEECKAELVEFEIVYYKAYRQATRLVSEYEVLVNSTTCMDEVTADCSDQDGEWMYKLSKLQERLEEFAHKLFHTKGHISVMSKSEKELTVHIHELSEACIDMDETISDLDKVRDAIQAFDTCAGLGRPQFHIPEYTGVYKVQEYNSAAASDAQIDDALNSWCADVIYKGLKARAAEVSEIMQQSVRGMPARNPVISPLYGTCPHCDGNKDESGSEMHASGHYRNCWGDSAPLDGSTMKSDCGHNSFKAVLCVVDRWDSFNNETSGEDTPSACGGLASASVVNKACKGHVDWAFNNGWEKHPEWYGQNWKTINDFQRAFYCGRYGKAKTCDLPPCSCSEPPCDVCEGDYVS